MNSSLFRLRPRELARPAQRPGATDQIHVDVEAVVDGLHARWRRRGFRVGQERSSPRDEVLLLLRHDRRAAALEAEVRRTEDHRGAAGPARGAPALAPPPALHEDLIGSATTPKFCLNINAIDAGINQPHSLHEREYTTRRRAS